MLPVDEGIKINSSVPALRACHSHHGNPGVLGDPGIQEVRQVLVLLSHQKDPEVEQEKACQSSQNMSRSDAVGTAVLQLCVLRTAGPEEP